MASGGSGAPHEPKSSMEGKVAMLAPKTDTGAMATLLSWADAVARLKVRSKTEK